ncbi:MAG TPA: SRPBCC family protein [Anaerolineales bacterium]|nr:SRPBCC family protein [Anaerolineales bacterium]
MDAIELSIVIRWPVAEAFAFLANLENDVKWHSAFVEVRKTSGGARFLVFEGVLGRRTPGTEYEVTEYEPNRIVAWKTVSGPLQLKFWRTFERVQSGTRFAVRYEGEPRGFFKLAWPLITRMVKRQQGGDMRKLKELMEVRTLSV